MLHDLANDGGCVVHSNGQLRTEMGGDTEKGRQKPALQQKTIDDYYYSFCHSTNSVKALLQLMKKFILDS